MAVVLACRGDENDLRSAAAPERHVSAVTSTDVQTLGFEVKDRWTATSGATIVGLNPDHTQGQYSLEVKAQNYQPLNSVALSTIGAVGSLALLDLKLPAEQANQSWYGAIQLYGSIPSRNIFSSYFGQVELTGFPVDKWLTLGFQAPPDLVSQFGNTYSDLTFTIVLNVPYNQTASYLLDNLRFVADITPTLIGTATNTAGVLKAIFTYGTTAVSDVSIPYGIANGLFNATGLIEGPPEMPPRLFTSRQHSPFAATLASDQLTWKIGTHSATAYAWMTPLPTETAADGSKVAVLPDGTRFNIDAVPPPEPPSQPESPPGAPFFGTLNGKLTVGPSGAATYTLPIAIPPGVSGMAPNLNLVYNSQGRDGIAGQGWELTGLSLIHRCPKTRIHEGYSQPVLLMDRVPDQDALCLDGQKLFPRGDGTYEPEQKDFSTITKVSAGQAFKVVSKTGETRYYGWNPKARVSLDGLTGEEAIAAWALDRVVDAWGNYYVIHYNFEKADFRQQGLVVTSIDYTGHEPDANGSGALPTFNTIRFEYEPRKDVRHGRFLSETLPRNQRLKSIWTGLGTYSLKYLDDSDPMLPSRLASIKYSVGDQPLDEISFDWDGGGYGWMEAPSYGLPAAINPGSFRGTQFVDIDGDGLVDFVQAVNGTRKAWRNSGTGWVSAPPSWAPPMDLADGDGKRGNALFADVDGDGLQDFVAAVHLCVGTHCTDTPPLVWMNRFRSGGGWTPARTFEIMPPEWGGTVNFTDHDTLADMNVNPRRAPS